MVFSSHSSFNGGCFSWLLAYLAVWRFTSTSCECRVKYAIASARRQSSCCPLSWSSLLFPDALIFRTQVESSRTAIGELTFSHPPMMASSNRFRSIGTLHTLENQPCFDALCGSTFLSS